MKRSSNTRDVVLNCDHCKVSLGRVVLESDIRRVMPNLDVLEGKRFDSWNCVYSYTLDHLFRGNKDLPAAEGMRVAISRYNGSRRPQYVVSSKRKFIPASSMSAMAETESVPRYVLDHDPDDDCMMVFAQ